MRKLVPSIVAAIAASGCVPTKPVPNPYFDVKLGLTQHAVLQTLNGDKKKHPFSPFNPLSKSNWSTYIDGIKESDTVDWEPMGKSAGLLWARVVPGSYTVRVRCLGKGYKVWFELNMPDLRAGRDYLFECHGLAAADVTVLVSDEPTATKNAPLAPTE